MARTSIGSIECIRQPFFLRLRQVTVAQKQAIDALHKLRLEWCRVCLCFVQQATNSQELIFISIKREKAKGELRKKLIRIFNERTRYNQTKDECSNKSANIILTILSFCVWNSQQNETANCPQLVSTAVHIVSMQ